MSKKNLNLLKILLKISFPVLLLAGFFISTPKIKAETTNHLIISEVQITGGSGQTANDFIELYNPADTTINLNGYRLVKRTKTGIKDNNIKSFTEDEFIPAHGFYLWANSDYISISVFPNTTTTATIANDNGIALRFGKADEGEIIDALAWGEAENIFIETAIFPNNPEANQSIEKNLETMLFTLQTNPNPQNSGLLAQPPEPPHVETPASSSPSANPPAQFFYKPSDIVINEFVSDPTDDEVEWIELYNTTKKIIDLAGWTIEDNTEKPKKLEGLSIKPNDFLILNKGNEFNFSLNNKGDIIILKNLNKNIIDQVSYGNFNDDEINDNAPQADDPYSTARISDGYDTDNDFNDFKLTTTPTKGETNLITEKPSSVPNRAMTGKKEKNEKIYSSDIIINEIFPNPIGSDNEKEFVELKNIGEKEIDLLNWRVGDNSKKIYTINSADFDSTIIPAQGFFILYRQKTKLALNNTGGDNINLFWPNEKIADSMEYSGTAKEGQSYSRNKNEKWEWSLLSTPKEENIINRPNQTPKAVIESPEQIVTGEEIIFDASDSYDPDGDKLSYLWTFENGLTDDRLLPRHIFKKSGSYKISLKVKDSRGGENEAKIIVDVLEPENKENAKKIENTNEYASININEFLPNPAGDDGQEWIEIYNYGDQEINLLNWSLDDQEGGSQPYQISENIFIRPEEYLIFERAKTKIALNNTEDEVRLFNPKNKIISQVDYKNIGENYSYALNKDNQWQWTETPTPGGENIISFFEEKFEKFTEMKKIITADLKEIKDLEIGSLVKTQGIVSVEPGVLGSQIFYLGGSGMQVYCYKKDFPDLKLGDLIEISGKISESNNEKRIKIKTKNDIKILKQEQPPLPKKIEIEEMEEELLGSLIKIEGQLIEKTGDNLYVDDGNEEVRVYIKKSTGIKIPQEIREGDYLEITGIASKTSSGYRILPRYQDDIVITKKIEVEEFLPGSLANLSNKIQLSGKIKYLLITIATIMIIAIGLFFKKKKAANL